MIKAISNTNGRPMVYVPLTFIICVNSIKNGFEDLKRHQSDKKENNSKTMKLTQHGFDQVNWKDLYIGDIVKIAKDELVPADVLVIHSSEEKNNCFIETKNLDGETNLKEKKVSLKIVEEFGDLDPTELYKKRNIFKFEKPNPYLYNFMGALEMENGEKCSLDNSNFVLRGSKLRNTGYCYGLVCYTGHETKIMLNSIPAQIKMSLLEKMMNSQILNVCILQIACCLGFAVLSVIYQDLYVVRFSQFCSKNGNFSIFSLF